MAFDMMLTAKPLVLHTVKYINTVQCVIITSLVCVLNVLFCVCHQGEWSGWPSVSPSYLWRPQEVLALVF